MTKKDEAPQRDGLSLGGDDDHEYLDDATRALMKMASGFDGLATSFGNLTENIGLCKQSALAFGAACDSGTRALLAMANPSYGMARYERAI